ncbi:trehalose-phosphatase [Thalassiella azotivora]
MTGEGVRGAFEALRGRSVLVALDFDGVLAPIVEDRDAATPLPEASAALRRLVRADGSHLALVSGRALEDLRLRAGPPEGALLVASHGAEVEGAPTDLDDAERERLERVMTAVRDVVDDHPGTDLETKPAGAVLHTRQADRDVAAAATRAVLDGPATLDGVHAMQGKEVVELSVVDTDKGRAVTSLREQLGVDAVVYIGDDVTDETVFRVLGEGDVGVKVGDGDTAAGWRLPDPPSAAVALHHLADVLGAPAAD